MMTPDDAKRLVKNRNARNNRAQDALDRAEEAELDFIEEALAIYFSDSDFVEYVTDFIDKALQDAINTSLPLRVAFVGRGKDVEDKNFVAHMDKGWYEENAPCQLALFDARNCGIDYSDGGELAKMFAETVRALYEDAGWSVGEVDWNKYKTPNPHEGEFYSYIASSEAWGFEIFY